jgi:hypothetical protein
MLERVLMDARRGLRGDLDRMDKRRARSGDRSAAR